MGDRIWVEYFAHRVGPDYTTLSELISHDYEASIVNSFIEGLAGKKILEKYWTSKELVRDVHNIFVKKK